MATDMQEKKPCDCPAVSVERLDQQIRDIYNGVVYLNDVKLKDWVCKVISRNIDWKNLRYVRVIGDADRDYLERFEKEGLSRGFYLNADGTWLLLILPEKPYLGRYFSGCSGKLESLWIINSQMFSRDLGKLPGLRELYLEDNPMVDSIEQLEALEKMEKLTIINSPRLTELPGLEKLTGLTYLNLYECSCITVLPELEKLTRLTFLNLCGCSSVKALPGLENLTRLTALYLTGCSRLKVLPGLDKLTELTHLSLYGCSNVADLPSLENLSCLTMLNLFGCSSLTTLPGLEKLTELTFLSLSECSGLTTIPDGIRQMKALRRLDLRFMKLTELPDWLPEIAEKFTLETNWDDGDKKAIVSFEGTTVEGVDMSIFDQPYEMVVKWFEERKLGRTQPLNEIKVVFLGDGEAGKSHTIARLMNDGGDPDYAIFDGQSTPGIVIRNKEYDLGNRKIQVHYWDFGGQEIMHSMHRIFLTGRTMYVILLNARDDTQSDRAKYWLHNVKSFAPDAPVLLVLNKIDQNENASVDERELRGRYEKLTQVVRLSALKYSQEEFNRRFTEVLLEEIENTGYLDAQWPISWTQVKEKLENMTGHYITGDAYQDICAGCKVDENQKDLLHWFNDLGISFCCDGEDDYTLKDYVILRPDWITNALYIILFNKLEGARNGLIPHKSIYNLLRNAHNNPDIRCTLPQARYTSGDIDYVLRIMRKFNLSFTDGHDNEFIPMLCQQNSMVDIQYYQEDADTLEFNMEFDYLPNNLLHRLMVERYGELDMTTVWRTGARFQLNELGYSAVLVIDGNTLRFFIRHTNPMHRPNTYLTMLKAHVDRIVAKMGLKAPICQLIYKLDGKRDEFEYEMLKDMKSIGQTLAFSREWRRMIPIQDILNQAAPDGIEDEKKLLDAILRSCRNIQGESTYCLNGDDRDKENQRNRRVRDDLSGWGYNVQDQSQRGFSGSGKGIGELDLLICNDQREPWTVIEALRVSNGAKSTWKEHLDKLVGNYNYFGARFSYLLTYMDVNPVDFARIWEDYQEVLQKHHPGQYTYLAGSFVDLNGTNSPQNIKVAKCHYSCGGDPITVYHIFARIPTQNG